MPAPKPRRRRYPGRRRIDDRRALASIIFVLRTGIGWENLPQELGCSSGMTCWRRQRAWLAAGVWDHLQTALIRRLDRQPNDALFECVADVAREQERRNAAE